MAVYVSVQKLIFINKVRWTMDIERYLIILKGEDKTDKIRSYEYAEGWKVNVRFYKPDKTYSYSKSNFQFYSNPI